MKSVVITGCSTGLGRAAALRLARDGWRVFATVRKPADAASLNAAAHAGQLETVLCDITRAGDVAALRAVVEARTNRLEALVNNAGTGYPGPLALLPLDDVRAQLEVNTIAHLAVTQALLPLLRRAHGTIIIVSSVGGRVVFPLNGPYHMSKWALEAMSDALRLELAPFGVKVVVVEPGSSPTAIWDTSLNRAAAGAGWPAAWGEYGPLAARVERAARAGAAAGFSPERFGDLVAQILASRRPRARYVLGRTAPWLIRLRRWLPDSVWDWAARRVLRW
jgi:NAD(P)-dependent dehydrogenase (short-subunit alcohol dehydrogenase family)